ncbi:MAG: helicase-related protein [Bacteroidota bacterium]
MLIDNNMRGADPKIYQWIDKHVKSGDMDIVTGYFTVGALAWLARNTNAEIRRFRFVIGDIVSHGEQEIRGLDLLNEDLSLQRIFELPHTARNAVNFLRQDKVKCKTLEPNFCHAKLYLYKDKESRADRGDKDDFYITGSSNLTEAGIGLKISANVELNVEGQGTDGDYNALVSWFEDLWQRKEAHNQKTIREADGRIRKVNFKTYLIEEISRIFHPHTPKDIYYKVLFELFGDRILEADLNPKFSRRIGRLENTAVYQTLYEFQKKGVLSLIGMLQQYEGAILADAVGLGKTWQALAVMKFFEMEGHEVILLCPKKLDHNWRKYHERQGSRFEEDRLRYVIRYHTDLQDDRLERREDRLKIRDYFQSDRPKLLVIDESHNLRNAKSNRYKFLVDTILKPNADIKVLMLSATPINNSLMDIRNQFKLMVKDNSRGFDEKLGVRSLDYVFRMGTRGFKEWREDPDRTMATFIRKLPSQLFKLTDALTVARTRQMVAKQAGGLHFPVKARPDNVFVTPEYIGNFESFDELFEAFPDRLSAYLSSWYVEQEKKLSILEDAQIQDRFLVQMMYILMVKRLESSWYSFKVTVERILDRHQTVLDLVRKYELTKKESEDRESGVMGLFTEEDEIDLSQFELGSRRKVRLADIEAAGNLKRYKKHLKEDIEALSKLKVNLDLFQSALETRGKSGMTNHRVDNKLELLIRKIREKRETGHNRRNPKVLIFTVYTDTATYLYDKLREISGLGTVAVVSSQLAYASDSEEPVRDFETILERFAPFTKLCREKVWKGYRAPEGLSPVAEYAHWDKWVRTHQPRWKAVLDHPVDILIATDVLSEGQNLQDCDFVINYDIHWNPVRIIQRMGRIDRLGSPNDTIYGLNFWPSENINRYLDLQSRIEDRMVQMRLAGSEVDQRFTEGIRRKSQNADLDREQEARMLRQMEASWDDIEVSEDIFGFDDLSLQSFRQDLADELQEEKEKYDAMPRGVYSGCVRIDEHCPEEGILALVGYPARAPKMKKHRYQHHDLLYINLQGESVRLNQQEILYALAQHKDCDREVPSGLDAGDPVLVKKLSQAMQNWLNHQIRSAAAEASEDRPRKQPPNGKSRMGKAGLDLIRKLQQGDTGAIRTIERGETLEQRYQAHKYDLLAWLYVH